MSPLPADNPLPVLPAFAHVPDAAACRARIGMLQTVLDGLFDAACVVDGASLALLGLNGAAERQLGRSAAELVGQPVTLLVASPEDHHFWMAALDAQRTGLAPTDTRLSLHSDTLIQRADGTLDQVERRIVPIELPSGHCGWLLTWHDDGPRHRAEQEVDRLAAELGATLEGSRDAVLVTDLDGAVRGSNQVFLTLIGCAPGTPADEARLTDRLQELVADARQWREHWVALRADPRLTRTELVKLADGRTLEWHSVAQYAHGEPVGRVHVLRDLTAQLADEARLRVAAEVFDNTHDAVFVLDAQWRIAAANRAAARLSARELHRLSGQVLTDMLFDAAEPATLAAALQDLASLGRWEGEVQLRNDDARVPVHATLAEVGPHHGSTSRYIVTLRDLSERQAQQHALRELTQRDPLTRLPNRQRLAERVQRAVDLAQRQSGGGFAMLAIGLDRFTHINDSLGHDVGDDVLVEMAARLSRCVRQEDMVARLGGDTFVVLLHQAGIATAQQIAARCLDELRHEMCAGEVDFSLHASIGAAMFPAHGATMDQLVKNADIAMHHAKRGGGGLRFYEAHMHSELLAQVRLDHAMREALREHRYVLHFQPQFDLCSGALMGVEALLRWHDPVLGNVPPGQFIPVAEQTGFIIELGDHVLQMALERAATWYQAGARVPVAVNISALQFHRSDFVERVLALLRQHHLPGEMLELELTEGVLLGNVDQTARRLHELAAQGISLAIDDFGTGYSSLGYLKHLPIHRLKIDRSFVHDLPGDTSDAAIVRSITELGRALNLRIVAEGVETEAQRDFLVEAGCHEAQGFLYAAALPVAQLERRFHLLPRTQAQGSRRRRRA